MRLLVVEDEDGVAEELIQRVRASVHPLQRLDRAANRADACALVAEHTYDVALIDLRIPSASNRSDASTAFGRAVEAELARVQPGVLRLFLTAFSANEVADALSSGESDHFFVPGSSYPTVHYFQKDLEQINRCVQLVLRHNAELDRLDAMPVENASTLDPDCRRALAIALTVVGGTHGRVEHPGGLSGSKTALLECLGPGDQLAGRCFVKIGTNESIDAEASGFDAVRFRWPSPSMPQLACRLTFGIGRNTALVYTHAPSTQTFFELCRSDPEHATRLVRSLADVLSGSASGTAPLIIRDVRRHFISDDRLAPHLSSLTPLGLHEVESVTVRLAEQLQHGDLHGANLLVRPDGGPFLIDFGRTGTGHGPLDPVVLEASLLFHPASTMRALVSEDRCGDWSSGRYADGTPMQPVVEACRELAHTLGHDDASIAAIGWSQALRQLKYADASATHALAIAASCGRQLRNAD